MSDKKTPPPKKSKPRRRRRRLMRWLFFIGLILSLLIGIVQGPVLRKIATDLIRKELDAAGFKGSFIVDGSLFSGLELRAVHLTSTGYLHEFHANRLRVDYKLSELIKGNIEEIVGEDIDIWIELSPPPVTAQTAIVEETKDTPPATSTEINLEDIRHKVLPIKFLLNRCSVGISREKKWLWRAENISLTHRQDAEEFHLSLGRFVDMDEVELENQQAILTWSENFTSLKNFPIRAKAILSHLRCRWDQTTPEHIEALINWQQGLFMFQLDDLKKAKVELSSGEIDLDRITPWIGLEGEMGGKVTALQASVADIMAPPDTMDANLKIEGKDLYWKDKKISHLQINTSAKNGQINLSTHSSITPNNTISINAEGHLAAEAPGPDPDWMTCWHGANAHVDIKIPEPAEIARWSEIAPPIGGWPNGPIHLSGDANLTKNELGDIKAQLLWDAPTWAKLQWEKLAVQATWNHATKKATAELKLTEPQGATITAQGNYSLDTEQYHGALSVKSLDIATLLPTLDLFDLAAPRAGNIHLNWSGQGRGTDFLSYQGKLDTQVTGLNIEGPEQPSIDIILQGHYAENLEVTVNKLLLKRDNLHLNAAGSWKDKQLQLTQLELLDNDLLLIKGQVTMPLSTELKDLDGFLKQAGELDIDLHVKDLPLAEIYEELPETIERKVRGNLSLDLIVKGSLLEPELQLQTEAKRIQVIGYKDVPAANISLKLSTQNNIATLDSKIKPAGYQALSLKGKMPFNPKIWIDDPDALMKETIDVALDTQSINLAPFSKFMPHISKLDGTLTASAKVSGTIGKPIITGKSRLKVSRVDSTKESIPDLRDLNIVIHYDHEKLTIEPSSCLVAGGKYNLKGTIGMEEITNPLFDISLTANKALIWRDDSIIVRADANLSLKGPYEKAHLQGEIGIVESLFYKDIQIIPIGGVGGGSSTSSQPEKAELPDFTRSKNKKAGKASIPAPFDQWTLDLRIRTKDDLLIRGNIAKGNVLGDLTIKGSFKEPQPTGRVFLNDAQASLPFSRLHVKEGKIIFSPQHGFDPQISIKATSKIGPNAVDITLYGLASSPKTLMTSSPPLPENEIIFLLATGSTSDKINDGGAVTGKAYQLLVDSMLRSSPGKFKKLKQTLTELNQKVNINIGATDPFTGKKYNSASVELHDRWYVIASSDVNDHTRGLLVYAVRFK